MASMQDFSGWPPARRKIVNDALRDFRLSGVDLPDPSRRRFREISLELSELSNRFDQNLLDATNHWCLHLENPEDVAGLPELVLDSARQSASRSQLEGWKFTLHGPSYIAFMTHADRRDLRRIMYEAYATRASDSGPDAGKFDNSEIMVSILRLRRELAGLVSFDHYADYSLASKMAESYSQVEDFLLQLAERSTPAALRDLAELRAFAADELGIDDLEAWDLAYASEKLRLKRFKFSQEDVRPYFPLPNVLSGMFSIVEKLFGISVQRVTTPQVWHPDVSFYEIRDTRGEICGRFFVDLYARDKKRGGAWMGDCITRWKKLLSSEVQIPVAYLVCNFAEPVGEDPSLLTHEEVLTLFHEFGHGLHHMLTQVDEPAAAGINGVPWDAVELPSQLLENWCWEREALNMISSHHQTGETLPDTLLDRLRLAKNFESGMQMLRQIEFSLFDLRIHGTDEISSSRDIQMILNDVRNQVAVVRAPEFNRFQHSFSHIFAGGYAAGYYSYKWAEVLSADAFSLFEENGIFDRGTGKKLLQSILERGGSEDPLDLFVEFRGRPPSVDALLRHSGLQS